MIFILDRISLFLLFCDTGLIIREAFDCPEWDAGVHTEVNVLCNIVNHGVNVLTMGS